VKSCATGAINNWNPAWTGANAVPTPGSALASALTLGSACVPINPALMTTDPNFQNIRPATINPFPAGTIVRQVYLNEKIDGTTLASLGLQLNGVPFEYKVTETPRKNTREVWQFINTTGDAHPMHPHLVRHQIVARQNFNVGQYLALLCGSTTCQAGPAPGGEMQVIPDVTPLLTNNPNLVTTASVEGGWKDATQAIPGMVTTIVADWSPRWDASQPPTAPGTAGCPNGKTGCAAPYFFEDVTTGPYVWHCHINSHEDSEMMHTSLVVP
jgi:FtsP/CotA-like multicopper oxidase with cupredoxin domain